MPLAKKSEEQVVLTMDGFPLKFLARWMEHNGCPNLTDADAKKLLQDKEFKEILVEDLFNYGSDCLGDAISNHETDCLSGLETYADVLNRLQVPHNGDIEDEDDSDLHDDYDSDIDEEEEVKEGSETE